MSTPGTKKVSIMDEEKNKEPHEDVETVFFQRRKTVYDIPSGTTPSEIEPSILKLQTEWDEYQNKHSNTEIDPDLIEPVSHDPESTLTTEPLDSPRRHLPGFLSSSSTGLSSASTVTSTPQTSPLTVRRDSISERNPQSPIPTAKPRYTADAPELKSSSTTSLGHSATLSTKSDKTKRKRRVSAVAVTTPRNEQERAAIAAFMLEDQRRRASLTNLTGFTSKESTSSAKSKKCIIM